MILPCRSSGWPSLFERCAPALQTAFAGIQIVVFGHLGDGSLHYNTFLPGVLGNEVYQYEDAVNTIVYENVLACAGTIAAEHGIGQVKNQWFSGCAARRKSP